MDANKPETLGALLRKKAFDKAETLLDFVSREWNRAITQPSYSVSCSVLIVLKEKVFQRML